MTPVGLQRKMEQHMLMPRMTNKRTGKPRCIWRLTGYALFLFGTTFPSTLNAGSITVLKRRPAHNVVLDINTAGVEQSSAEPLLSELRDNKTRSAKAIGQSFALHSKAIRVEVTDVTLRLLGPCNFTREKQIFQIVFTEDTNGNRIGDTQMGLIDSTPLKGVRAEQGEYINITLDQPVTLLPLRIYSLELWYKHEFNPLTNENQFNFLRSASDDVFPAGYYQMAQGLQLRNASFPVGEQFTSYLQSDMDLILIGKEIKENTKEQAYIPLPGTMAKEQKATADKTPPYGMWIGFSILLLFLCVVIARMMAAAHSLNK